MSHVSTIRRPNLWLTNNDEYDFPTSLGAELIANGDFSAGSSSWTLGTGWTIVSNAARATGPITDIDMTQTVAVSAGELYLVEFDIVGVSLTTWSVQMSLAGYTHKWISGAPSQCEGARKYKFVMRAVNNGGSGIGNGLNFRATVGGSAYFAIDNVSVKHSLTTDKFHSQNIEGVINPRKGSFDEYGYSVSDWSVSFG